MPRKFRSERKLYGNREALKRMFRRDRGVVGYLILAAAVAYSFSVERDHSNQNRKELAEHTRSVLIAACDRNNDLRKALVGILASSEKESLVTYRDNPARVARIKLFYDSQTKKLAPINCEHAYPAPQV